MKKFFLSIALSALMLASFAPSSSAAMIGDQEITTSVDVSFVSKYIWRGYNLVDDWTVQPSVDFSFGDTGAFINFWYSKAFDNDYKGADELDITVGKSTTFNEVFTLDFGLIGYIYPELESADSTAEVYVGMSYDWIITPSATWYYDFDDYKGSYLLLGLSYSYEVMENLTLDPSASVGFNIGKTGLDNGVNDVVLSLGATYTMDAFYFTLAGSYIFNQEDLVNVDDEGVFSISVGASF